MPHLMSNYIIGNSIGRGSFGSVYYCINKETGKEYAIKILSKSKLQKQTVFTQNDEDSDAPMLTQLALLYKEINFMKNYPHACFMSLLEVIDNKAEDKISLVLEIAEGILSQVYEDKYRSPCGPQHFKVCPQLENLSSLVTQPVQPQILFQQMHQTSLGLHALHSIDYIHGDLKPANILKTTNKFILADFGMTQPEREGMNFKLQVSPAFMSPDMEGLTKANDVWAFGVIFFLNLTGFHPAALVSMFCVDQQKKYTESHWGFFFQKNFKDISSYFMQQLDFLVQNWVQQYKQVSKLYGAKMEIDSIQTLLGYLGTIIVHCFAPVDKRPTMKQINAKLNDLFVKYQSSKLQKHFKANKDVAATLSTMFAKYSTKSATAKMVMKINNFKIYSKELLEKLDKDVVEISINQSFMPSDDSKTPIKLKNMSGMPSSIKAINDSRESPSSMAQTPKTLAPLQKRPTSKNNYKIAKIEDDSSSDLINQNVVSPSESKISKITTNLKINTGPSAASQLLNKLNEKVEHNKPQVSTILKGPSKASDILNRMKVVKPNLQNTSVIQMTKDSDSDSDLPIKQQTQKTQQLPQNKPEGLNFQNTHAMPDSIISARFPGIKIPLSGAAKLAMQFAEKADHNQQQEEDSDGPIMLRATKPKAEVAKMFEKPVVPALKTQGLTNFDQPMITTARNLNVVQTELIKDDDLFDLELDGNDYKPKQEIKDSESVNLQQRQNYFIKLNVHYEEVKYQVDKKQVKTLFQNIHYTQEKYKLDEFQYDRSQDQNQLVGLGSFQDTMSAGGNSDDMEDFSDDDDLIEIGDDSDPEKVMQQVNSIIDPDNEDNGEQWKGGLLQTGRGKGMTIKEETPQELKQSKTTHDLAPIPTGPQQSVAGFLSARIMIKTQTQTQQGANILPFVQQSARSQFEEQSSKSKVNIFDIKEQSSVMLKQVDMSSDSSSNDFISNSAVQPPVQQAPMFKGPGLNLFGLEERQREQKLKLFDEDSDENLTMNQKITSRIATKSSAHSNPLNGMVSARGDVKREMPEGIELSSKQTVIFFRKAIIMFNMVSQLLEQQDPKLIERQNYRELKTQFIHNIKMVEQNQKLVSPVLMEDLLMNFILWKDGIMKMNQNCVLMRLVGLTIKHYEVGFDCQPVFLRPQCGWVLHNAYTLYTEFDNTFSAVNQLPGNQIGIQVSINNQVIITSNKQQFHELQLYVGLEKAEQTPIVGVRHKTLDRTLVCQVSDRSIMFQPDEQQLTSFLKQANPVYELKESLSTPQRKFFSFKFMKNKAQSDFNQYSYSNMLYQLFFISVNKMVVLPYVFMDCLYDLIFNARMFSKPSTIRAGIFNSEDNFYLVVSDAGSGLEEPQTEQMFQTGQGFSRSFGNGSGLAKLKMVVGFYGGVVNISAVEKGGSKVIVKIPMCGDLNKYSSRM